MSSSATQKKTQADATPFLTKSWWMKVYDQPAPLSLLDLLEVSYQEVEPGGTCEMISGSVLSSQPTTAYAIENGTVSHKVAHIFEVSFTLIIDGDSYAFVGLAQGSSIVGFYARSFMGHGEGGVETEEGSWSAQAKPGPGEEDKKPHGKHAKRVSQ
jgi:hypothetical protein